MIGLYVVRVRQSRKPVYGIYRPADLLSTARTKVPIKRCSTHGLGVEELGQGIFSVFNFDLVLFEDEVTGCKAP